jgi:hypothetical protein
MWVLVTEAADGRYRGELTNRPVYITTIGLGDVVEFGPEHIISTLINWPLLDKRAMLSPQASAQQHPPRYVYRETPSGHPDDSGWMLLSGQETEAELTDPTGYLTLEIGYLIDRWPQLEPVFRTDPENADWVWDEGGSRYRHRR